jgi:hypothetical protein
MARDLRLPFYAKNLSIRAIRGNEANRVSRASILARLRR